MDPKVNGQLQKEWGWLVAAYMFLGGMAGGAYTLGAINSLLDGGIALTTTVALWIAFPAVSIGMLFLLADLGSPTRARLAGKKPKTSWISRGEMIVTVFMILSLAHLVLHQFVGAGGGTMKLLAVLGIILAIGTMSYTGMLLGASKGMPFWRSGVVPVIFVVSAMASGQFAILFGVSLFGSAAETAEALRVMSLGAAILIVLEVLAVLVFLQAAYRQPDSRESAERILRKGMFVMGYVVLGRAMPLVSVLIAFSSGAKGMVGIIAPGAVLGLYGGLLLRQAVLIGGALPTWNMGGFQFRRIHRPKEPKPGIGTLPPQ